MSDRLDRMWAVERAVEFFARRNPPAHADQIVTVAQKILDWVEVDDAAEKFVSTWIDPAEMQREVDPGPGDDEQRVALRDLEAFGHMAAEQTAAAFVLHPDRGDEDAAIEDERAAEPLDEPEPMEVAARETAPPKPNRWSEQARRNAETAARRQQAKPADIADRAIAAMRTVKIPHAAKPEPPAISEKERAAVMAAQATPAPEQRRAPVPPVRVAGPKDKLDRMLADAEAPNGGVRSYRPRGAIDVHQHREAAPRERPARVAGKGILQ